MGLAQGREGNDGLLKGEVRLENRRQALIFFVGEHQYAMDILHLREVGRMPQLEPEPGAPVGVVGVARMHGVPVRVHDLSGVLGEPTSEPAPEGAGLDPDGGTAPVEGGRPWLIVSREETGERHWMVDGVQDIVEYDPAQVRHHGPEAESDPGSAGLLEVDGRLTHVLTPALLARRAGAS